MEIKIWVVDKGFDFLYVIGVEFILFFRLFNNDRVWFDLRWLFLNLIYIMVLWLGFLVWLDIDKC